ncbi:MAG: O-antigen ligase family protein, partial [Anaerolineae bacterium]
MLRPVGKNDLSPAGLSNAIIEAGILLTLIIAPLYFNPRTEHTFEPDKAALLRSVVLIALLTWVIRMNFEFRISKFEIGLLRTPLVLPALLLITAYVIGTATSVLPRVSFWGAYERGQGLYTLIAYIVLFFLVRETMQAPVQQQRLLDAILLVSLPISVYAVLQHLGLDPLSFRTGGAAVTLRAISTLGNPIFLGAYLIMVIPLTGLRIYQAWEPGLAVCRRKRLQQSSTPHIGSGDPSSPQEISDFGLRIANCGTNPKSEIRNPKSEMDSPGPLTRFSDKLLDAGTNPGLAGIYSALLILQLATLFFAQSRGPTLGLIGGLGFGALVWAARQRARRVVVAGGVVVVLGIAATSLLPALASETTRLGRLGELADPTSRTARQRVLVWGAAAGLVATEPARMWVGYGPETLRDVIGPHMSAEIAGLKPNEDFDRAHNAVLDLWATTGLLGVAAYLLLIGAVLYYGLRVLGLVSEASDRRLFLALTLAGTLLGGLVPWLGIGRQWVGVGLPLGLLGGVGAFVVWHGLRVARRRSPMSGDELLVVALLAAVVAHVVETLVGIAIVATHTLFWIYAALIAGLTTNAREIPASKSEIRNPKSEIPIWALVTGITLALFSFPLLTAGEARSGMAWGVIASATLLFGFLRLLSGRIETDQPVVRYVVVAVGAVLAFSLLRWLPWPPLDLTHSTVATFAYVILAVLALAVALIGVDHLKTLLLRTHAPLHLRSVWRWSVYGVLAVSTLPAIWLSNVNPIRADVFYKEGLGLSVAGSLQNAAHALEMSVALDPWEDRYHSGVGAAYAQMAQAVAEPGLQEGRLSRAETHLQEAHRLDPYRADHLRNLGVLQRMWADLGPATERTSHLRQASTYYEQAAMRNPVNVRVWREWGESHAALGEWDAAIQRYDESLRLNDGFVETWLLLAEAKLHQADYDGARQAYARALAL